MIREGIETPEGERHRSDPDQSAIRAEDHRQARHRTRRSTSSRRPRATTRSACSIASRRCATGARARRMPFEQFVTPDGLHMNDWGYACVAKLLARRDPRRHQAAGRDRDGQHRAGDAVIAGVYTSSSAASRSSHTSSGCSSPHDSRTIPSVMPSSARAAGADALMRRRRRMGDQALGVAEIVRDAHQLERILEAERARLAALRPRTPPASSRRASASARSRPADDPAGPDRSCA